MFDRILLCMFVLLLPLPVHADSLLSGGLKAAVGGAVAGSIAADELRRGQYAAVGNQLVWELPRWRERIKDIGEVLPTNISANPVGTSHAFKKLLFDHMKMPPGTPPLVILEILMISSGSGGRSYVIHLTPEPNLRSEQELQKPN